MHPAAALRPAHGDRLEGSAPAGALRAYGRTLAQLKFAILTVMAALTLAFVMNESGETQTLGLWLAGARGLFALLSPILGWLGVAVTGSDTSSNSLFGGLQVTAALQAHLSPTLLAAANSSGGVVGKMISPQNLAIVAGAVGLQGREGEIFRLGRQPGSRPAPRPRRARERSASAAALARRPPRQSHSRPANARNHRMKKAH